MIAALVMSAALAAAPATATATAAQGAAKAQAASSRPPAARAVVQAQFAAAPSGGGLSGAEADKLYELYLGRIGQAPPSQATGAGAGSGGGGAPVR